MLALWTMAPRTIDVYMDANIFLACSLFDYLDISNIII